MSNKQTLEAMKAELEALKAENTKLTEVAEAAEAKARKAALSKGLQVNGFITCPKGTKKEWVGKEFVAVVTVKGTFSTSSNGNTYSRITSKCPLSNVTIDGQPAVEPVAE